jgi:hypothetical protein
LASAFSRAATWNNPSSQAPNQSLSFDRSHTLDFELAANLAPARESPTAATEVLQKATGGKPSRIVPYTDMTAAIRDLKDGKLSAVYLIESDYMSTGKIVAYSPERGIFSDLAPLIEAGLRPHPRQPGQGPHRRRNA